MALRTDQPSTVPLDRGITRARWVLCVGHAVDDLYQGAVPALIPYLALARHYDYAAAAGITLAATLLSSLAQPLFGMLTDRRPVPRLIPYGLALAGLGIGLSGLGESYLLTWLAVALSGLGVAAYHPEAARAARAASAGSHVAMSWFSVAGTLGFTAAPLLVPLVVESGGVAATPLLAVPALVMAVVTGYALPALRRPRAAGPPASAGAPAGPDQWRPFLRLSAVIMARSIIAFGISTFLVLFTQQRLSAGPHTGQAVLLTFFAAGVLGTLWGGRLAERHSRVRIMRVAYLATVPGLLVLLFAPRHWLLLGAAWTAVALNVPFSLHVTLGQDYLPNRIGTASGVTLGLAVSVGGLAAPLIGTLADRTTLQAALTTLLLCSAAAVLLTIGLHDPTARDGRATSGG
ncbi:MFS transporter [Micromonospora sp. CPCC 205556]|uniref:MFS transporter n=1 Tax=Micromonospora sp. CPCC 205556 TaxID=3122398 RepID=UPI002FF23735